MHACRQHTGVQRHLQLLINVEHLESMIYCCELEIVLHKTIYCTTYIKNFNPETYPYIVCTS